MADMMGLPQATEAGAVMPLPTLVEMLVEATGVDVGRGASPEVVEVAAPAQAAGSSSASTSSHITKKPNNYEQREYALLYAPAPTLTSPFAAGTLGSMLGPGVIKKVENKVVVDISLAPAHSKNAPPAAADALLFQCGCGKMFAHRPAMIVHSKFCFKGSGARAKAAVHEAGSTCTPPPRAQIVCVDVDDSANDAGSDRPNAKFRKSDGKRKLSGLREGQHRTPYTLYFKLQVATEFEHLLSQKEKGFISDPLQKCSVLYNGLSTSNIWNWYKQKDQLRSARDKAKTPTANMVVNYDRRVTKCSQLHGRVASTLTADKYGVKEWWTVESSFPT